MRDIIGRIAQVGVMGAIGLGVVGLAVFVVGYSVVSGEETETSKAFATALAGPGLGGILVAVGKFLNGGNS